MSHHFWYDCPGMNTAERWVGGYFAPQGAGVPTIQSYANGLWTVSRVSAGLYRVQFTRNYTFGMTESIKTMTQMAALNGIDSQVLNFTPASSRFDIEVFTTSTGATFDVPAAGGNNVHWAMRTSSDNVGS